MTTIAHHITERHIRTEAEKRENNLLKLLGNKIVVMFRKENHTLGEYLLLYALIFAGILFILLVTEILLM